MVLNVPHVAVMRDAMLHDLQQTKRSWYMGVFQLPRVPERLILADGGHRLYVGLGENSAPGSFPSAR